MKPCFLYLEYCNWKVSVSMREWPPVSNFVKQVFLLSYFAFCPFSPKFSLQIVLLTSPPLSQPRVIGRKQEAEGGTRGGRKGRKSPQRLPVCLLRKFAILESPPPLLHRRLSEPTAHPCRLLLQPANPRYFHAIVQINNAEWLREESWPRYSGEEHSSKRIAVANLRGR